MRTIFITSFNPFIGRNILSTDVLGVLREQDNLRIVVFVPDYKVEYFKTQFGSENVIIEGVLSQKISRQDVLFRDLANSLADTSTLRFHRRRRRMQGGSFLRYMLSAFISRVLSRFAAIKRLARFFDQLTISKTKFAPLFDRYQPSLVFATDVFHDDDVHFLAEAKQRGIRTVGMIRSWDNITNKGMFRMQPDRLIVHNEVIKEEAMQYCDMPPERIFVSGMPQFDEYVTGSRASKEEVCGRFGLDSKKPLALIAPHGKRFFDNDWQILEILAEAQEAGEIPRELQFIVRIPPNDAVPLGEFRAPKNFVFEHPGVEFTPGRYNDREVTPEDTKTLADELHSCAFVLHFGSTVAIDAAFFDAPNVVILFDGRAEAPYFQSARRFLEYEHLQKYFAIGASRMARSRDDLVAAISFYCVHPEAEREARRKAVETQCAFTDGKSGARIAQFLLTQ